VAKFCDDSWARTCVSVCVCLSVCPRAYLRSHTRSLPIFVHVAYDRGSVLLQQDDEIPSLRGSFGVFFPIDNALSCSRRDHSVYQASEDRNPENPESRRCGLSAGKGVMGVHSAGKVWYLRSPCWLLLTVHNLLTPRVGFIPRLNNDLGEQLTFGNWNDNSLHYNTFLHWLRLGSPDAGTTCELKLSDRINLKTAHNEVNACHCSHIIASIYSFQSGILMHSACIALSCTCRANKQFHV